MNSRSALAFAAVSFACVAFLLSAADAQEDKPAPTEYKAKFHVDFRAGNPNNPNVRPVRDGNFKWETGGARITMPAGEGKLATDGVAAQFKIKGDFEITTSYEIIKADKPDEGYGVGVSMFVAIDPDTLDAVSLARRVGLKGKSNFMSDRMEGNDKHFIRTTPSKAPVGKLRIQRVGTSVRFYVADGMDGEFVPIVQDAKAKKIDVEFGSADIRYFQIGADAGDSQAAIDARFLDLTVRAEELPGLIVGAQPKKEEPAWMQKARQTGSEAPPPPPGTPIWLIALIAGAGLVVLLAIGGAAFALLRRKPVPLPASAKVTSGALSFVCPACGKKHKVKPDHAGKKIKCPDSGQSIVVPKARKKDDDSD